MVGNFRFILNTNNSENSEITAEPTRVISFKFTSQVSIKLEQIGSYLNLHILEAKNSELQKRCCQVIKCVENTKQ